MIMVYFAITVPLTVLVLGVVYLFWRSLDKALEKETLKLDKDARQNTTTQSQLLLC
jgi:hypothetical protein